MLTQSLSTRGLDLGETLMTPNEDNPWGFFENQRIVDLHEKALAGSNLSWRRPGTAFMKPKTASNFEAELKAVLESDFDNDRAWLVKDPRLSLTYPLWRPVLDDLNLTPVFINVLRHPDGVVRSLFLRNGISPSWGYQLYRFYVSQNFQILAQNPLAPHLNLCFEHLYQKSDIAPDALSAFVECNPALGCSVEFQSWPEEPPETEYLRLPYSQAGTRYLEVLRDGQPYPNFSHFESYVSDARNAKDFALSGSAFFEDLSIQQEIQLLRSQVSNIGVRDSYLEPLSRTELGSLIKAIGEAAKQQSGSSQRLLQDIEPKVLKDLNHGQLKGLVWFKNLLLLVLNILEHANARQHVEDQIASLKRTEAKHHTALGRARAEYRDGINGNMEVFKRSLAELQERQNRLILGLNSKHLAEIQRLNAKIGSLELDQARLNQKLHSYTISPAKIGIALMYFGLLRFVASRLPFPQVKKISMINELNRRIIDVRP